MSIRVLDGYVALIRKKMGKKYPKRKPSAKLLQKIIDENPYAPKRRSSILSKVLNGNEPRASVETLNSIAEALKMQPYEIYKEYVQRLNRFVENFIQGGYSIRYGSGRRVRLSNWEVTFDDLRNEFGITKISHDHTFTGVFEVDEDGLLFGKLKHEETSIAYSAFVDLEDTFLDKITFNISYKGQKQVYYSNDILYLDKHRFKSSELQQKGTIDYLIDDESKLPSNRVYLAFDYLQRLPGHSRIRPIHGNTYDHNLFISCPITSVFNNREDEMAFQEYVEQIRTVYDMLIRIYRFPSGSVQCKLLSAKHLRMPDPKTVYRDSLNHIKNASHYIAIIPKSLEDRNSSIYFELFHRIINFKPCIIFYEEEKVFPAVLKGFLRDNKQHNVEPINMDLEMIPQYIQDNYESLLNYNLR